VTARPYNVLFLCTGNSARSILAQSLINHWGGERFVGYSAGSYPKGTVHPISIALLEKLDMPTEGLRSKSWNEFARTALRSLENRIKLFVSVPIATLDRMKLEEQVRAIGKT
jgi:arsenate reductase